MATFKAACYDDKGLVTISEAARLELNTTVATMTKTMATRDATISTLQADKADLEKSKVQLETDMKGKDVLLTEKENAVKEANEEEKMPTWAIAIIVVIGAVLLLVIVILGVIVSR